MDQLPSELIDEIILNFRSSKDIKALLITCKTFNKHTKSEIWKQIFDNHYGNTIYGDLRNPLKYYEVCIKCGELIHLIHWLSINKIILRCVNKFGQKYSGIIFLKK